MPVQDQKSRVRFAALQKAPGARGALTRATRYSLLLHRLRLRLRPEHDVFPLDRSPSDGDSRVIGSRISKNQLDATIEAVLQRNAGIAIAPHFEDGFSAGKLFQRVEDVGCAVKITLTGCDVFVKFGEILLVESFRASHGPAVSTAKQLVATGKAGR